MSQQRRPAGTPAGGEFAPIDHAEVDLGLDPHGNVASHDLRVRRRLTERRFDDVLGPDDLSEILEVERSGLPDDVELPAHRFASFLSDHQGDVIDPSSVVAFARDDEGGDFEREAARAGDEELRSEAERTLAADAGLASWETRVSVEDHRLAFTAAGSLDRLDVSKYGSPDRTIGPSVDIEDIDDRVREARRADPNRIVFMGHPRTGPDRSKARVTVGLTDFEEEQVADALAARSLHLSPRAAKVLVAQWAESPLSGARIDEPTHDRVSRAVTETLPDTAGRTLKVAEEVRARVEDDFEALVEFTSGDDQIQAHFESIAMPYDYFHARKG